MNDLDALKAAHAPRDLALCNRLARVIEPTAGFFAYGVLWTLGALGLGGVGMIAGAGLGLGLGLEKGSNGLIGLGLAGFGLFALGAWLPFVRWAKRKRNAARMLVRDGRLVTGVVATSNTDRAVETAARVALAATGGAGGALQGLHWARVVFEVDGQNRAVLCPFAAQPAAGDASVVLYHPEAKYALGFDPTGRACVSGVHGG